MKHLTDSDQIAENAERLLDRRCGISTMQLIEVDVIRLQAAQGSVDAAVNVLARQSHAVRARLHRQADLGGDDDLVSARKLADRLSERVFAFAIRVKVCSVKEINAEIESLLNEAGSFVARQYPGLPRWRTKRHHAEAHTGNLEAAAAQPDITHDLKLR